jgi:DNA-binding MarR family transcriptional regulator
LTVKRLVSIVAGMDDPAQIEPATPTLIRTARGAYARSIRGQLGSIGIDDLPRNGAFILAGIGAPDDPRQDLPAELGVTKQAVSQMIDTLVNRGYLERGRDPGDRRRISLELTARGQQVVDAVLRGVQEVDRQLEERVAPEQVETMRSALLALTAINSTGLATGTPRHRPRRQLRRFEPIFPVRDLATALAHYSALGFETLAYDGGDEYGFANREGNGLHLAAHVDHDASHGAAAYLYVRDAQALYEEWSRPGIGGRTRPVGPTPYKLREGSHIDLDGNLIRFGSPMED